MAKFGERLASVFFLGLGAFVLGRKIGQKQSDSMSGVGDSFIRSYSTAGYAANAINRLFRQKKKVYVYWHLNAKKYTVSSIPLKETDWVFEEINRFIAEVRDDYSVTGEHVDNWRQKLEIRLFP